MRFPKPSKMFERSPRSSIFQPVSLRHSCEQVAMPASSYAEEMAKCSFGAWPLLSQSRDLRIEETAEGLFSIQNVFERKDCQAIIEAAEAIGMVETNPQGRKPQRGMAFRNNARVMIHDAEFAARLWEYLKPSLECIRREDGTAPVSLNPDFRIYRYTPGQQFGPHIDEMVWSEDRLALSEFTMLLYLSGAGGIAEPPLRGGETRFYRRGGHHDVIPEVGKLIIHWQAHDYLHEGLPVRSGVKWLLRTDVFYPIRDRTNRSKEDKMRTEKAANKIKKR